MTPEAATELVNRWHAIAGSGPNLGPAYDALRRAARNLLPGEVAASGAALIDGVPTVLVLSGEGLFLAHADTTGDERFASVKLRRLPVVADRITVELSDGLASAETGGGDALVHHWKFTWAEGLNIEFDGVARVNGGWDEAPDSAELLARALAETVGWRFPSGGA